MNNSSADNPKWLVTLTSWVNWILSLPVIRWIVRIYHDLIRYYKLEGVSNAAASAGTTVVVAYSRSSRLFRYGIPFGILLAGLFLCAAVLYHAVYDPVVIRLAHFANIPFPVDVVRVKQIEVTESAGGSGQVQQSVTVNLTSRITDNITEVPVKLGDIITPDTVLFKADPRPFEAALDAAKDNLVEAVSAEKMAEKQQEGYLILKKHGLASDQDVLQAESVVASARSAVANAQEALINSQLDLDSTVTKSPVTGIVLQRLINAKERLIPSQPTFQLGDLKNIYFLALIGEDKVGFVRAGLKAVVVFPAFPGETFPGEVFFVNPNADPTTRTITAYIRCPNPGIELKPGLSGFARLSETRHFLAVPDSAIINPVGQNASVFVISDDNRAHLRKVQLGLVAEGWTEIVSGVSEGELVSVVGALYLTDGDKVHFPKPRELTQ